MTVTRRQTSAITRKEYVPKKNEDESDKTVSDGGNQGTGRGKKHKREDSPEAEVEPPRKRTKRVGKGKAKAASEDSSPGPSTFRGNRGKLTRIKEDFPIEVLDMILSYLPPSSLLALARTAKEFRALLLSSPLVWKAAFEDARCPPKPDDLNYPEYAVLLYEAYCMHCGKRGAKKVDFMLRKRLCNNCWNDEIILYYEIMFEYSCFEELEPHIHHSSVSDWTIASFLYDVEDGGEDPEEDDKKHHSPWEFYRPEVEAEHAKLVKMNEAIMMAEEEEENPEGDLKDGGGRKATISKDEEMEDGTIAIASTKAEIDENDSTSTKVKKAKNVLREWKECRRGRLENLRKHSLLCGVWYSNHLKAKSDENAEVKNSRKEAIRQKLKALGWKDADILSDRVQRSTYLKQTRKLTDRIWSNIQNPLIELLTSARAVRLESAKRYLRESIIENLWDRYTDFVDTNITPRSWPYRSPYFPSSSEALELPFFRELFEREFTEKELDEYAYINRRRVVTDQTWEEMLDRIWEETEKWQKKAVRDLYGIVQKGLESNKNENSGQAVTTEEGKEDNVQPSNNAQAQGASCSVKNEEDDAEFDYPTAVSCLLQHRCLFECSQCPKDKILAYPNLLSHIHVRNTWFGNSQKRYGMREMIAIITTGHKLDSISLHQSFYETVDKMLVLVGYEKRERKIHLIPSVEDVRRAHRDSEAKQHEVVEEEDLDLGRMNFICQDCPWKQKVDEPARLFTLSEMLQHWFTLHPFPIPQKIAPGNSSLSVPPPLPLPAYQPKETIIDDSSRPQKTKSTTPKKRPEMIQGELFLNNPHIPSDKPFFICAICQKAKENTAKKKQLNGDIDDEEKVAKELKKRVDEDNISDKLLRSLMSPATTTLWRDELELHFRTVHQMDLTECKEDIVVPIDILANFKDFRPAVLDVYEKLMKKRTTAFPSETS